MLTFLIDLARSTWYLIAEMAPYLLFGFAMAGLLHVLIRPDLVQRWLGKPGLGGVVRASLIGVPMPLCSCSVIPVAASLRKSGATRGATASFLSSTPQTGVDSIFATYALLGGLFTAVRVLVAFICGIVTGYLIELCCKDPAAKTQDQSRAPEALQFMPVENAKPLGLQPSENMLSPATLKARAKAPRYENLQPSDKKPSPGPAKCCCSNEATTRNSATKAARYGFVTLPADLANALIVGLALAGLITTLMPDDLLTGSLSSGALAFLLATAISVPLYVCATASIPMAYALLAAGLSPGAALVFLITGPATNTATIATVWKMLGRSATVIYLLSLLIIAWLAGWIFNSALGIEVAAAGHHHHHALEPSLWQHGSGILFVGLLVFSMWKSRSAQQKSCCSS